MGFSSTLIFARINLPCCSSANFSNVGPSARHGPHQGAQKSMTTGTSWERCTTACSKSCSETSTVHSFIGNLRVYILIRTGTQRVVPLHTTQYHSNPSASTFLVVPCQSLVNLRNVGSYSVY